MDDAEYQLELENIKREALNSAEINHLIGENFQRLLEQSIGNVAAIDALNKIDPTLKELLGNP